MMIRLYREFDPHDNLIALDEEDTHYVKNVMRAKVNQDLHLFNAIWGTYRARIQSFEKKHCIVQIFEQFLPVQQLYPTALLYAPVKNDMMAFIFEKATELCVTHFMPIKTAHTQNYQSAMVKIQKQIKNAIQQCERQDMPLVAQQKSLIEAIDNFYTLFPTGVLYVALERSNVKTLWGHLEESDSTKAQTPIGIIVGPEGGFSTLEKKYFENNPHKVRVMSLGQTILRTETAIISALASITMWRTNR